MSTRPLLLCAVLFVAGSACAQYEREPVVDPRSYRSPSGQYTLRVDPSEHFGSGPEDKR